MHRHYASASSQGWLAIFEQHFMTDSGSEYVIDFLKPGKLSFKITYTPL